jgi:hypothetical protein
MLFKKILRKLENRFAVEVRKGGRHNLKVTSIDTNNSYPIPCSHNEINENVVKAFVEWLEINKVCTKKQFDDLINLR